MQLETRFVLDDRRRIVCTREPDPSPGPRFFFIRGEFTCSWAVRADVSDSDAIELEKWASQELPSPECSRRLIHAERHTSLLSNKMESGPSFLFPEKFDGSGVPELVRDEDELNHHFRGWVPSEIAAGRSPVLAIRQDGHVVSACFCARRSDKAAEAGVETAEPFRGRGFAGQVIIAWANHIRSQGLVPMYSTDWTNLASLVARKLGLVPFAAHFSID